MWDRISGILGQLVVVVTLIGLVAAIFLSGVLTMLDPSAVAVIVGVLAASVPSLVGQWYRERREDRRLYKQQQMEQERRLREEERAQREKIRNVYHNSVRILSEIVTTYSDSDSDLTNGLSPQGKVKQLREAHDWLTQLSLYHPEQHREKHARSNFARLFDDFTENPMFYGGILRDTVIRLAASDERLYPDSTSRVEDPQDNLIRVYVDEDYRRQQFREKAIDVPYSHQISCKWSRLTSMQREKIARLFFKGQGGVPQSITLKIPKFNEDGKWISKGETWQARLNPATASVEEIFSAWEAAYDQAMTEAPGSSEERV